MKAKKFEKLKKLYTEKQIEILSRAVKNDWFLMINHGAVRAGKTVVNNDLFLLELLRVKKNALLDGVEHPMYILAAVSSNTLNTNILTELTNRYGLEFKFDRHGNFSLFGVKVITAYTKTISGLGSIRGMTSYGAYINEASLANKEVFDEIIKRCSGSGARIICDTNPEYPSHWLKVDYIDKADDQSIIANHFSIFDNTFLNQRYVDNLIATTPSGAMTQRGIYGLWTAGKGTIYQDFDKETQLVNVLEMEIKFDRYCVGVDWGYDHTGVMVVVGVDSNGAYYLIEEHAEKFKHIDYWVEVAKAIQQKYGQRVPFYCDSARSEYVDQLYYEGLNAMNADKSVIPGISEVAKLMKTKMFFADKSAKLFSEEIDQYIWSPVGDAPVKKHDDCLDALRYAIYTDKIMQEQGFF